MVEKAKSASETETMIGAASPKAERKARIVRFAPEINLPVAGSVMPSVPEEAMTRPVSMQMIMVSKKVPVILT